MKKKDVEVKKVDKEAELLSTLAFAGSDKVWTVTRLALAFADKYGDEAFEILKKIGYARGERNAPMIEKLMKENGCNFNDPRHFRRYLRETTGFWGYVKDTDDSVVVKPDGKIKLEYRILKCCWAETWKEMGLSRELQVKLDSCLGYQSDMASTKYFNIKYECDQGLPNGRPWCKFIMEKM